MLSVECWVLNVWMLSVECWVLNGRLWRCWMFECWMLSVECWMVAFGDVEWLIVEWLIVELLHSSFLILHRLRRPFNIPPSTFVIALAQSFNIPPSTFVIFFLSRKKNFPVERVIFCFCFTIAKLRNVGRSCNSCGGVAGRLWRSSLYECWMCHYVIMSLCH